MYLFVQFLQGGGIFSSCEKNETPQDTNVILVNENLVNEEMTTQIQNFHKKLTTNLKSGETMRFGDALFLLEASFNYYHSFITEDYSYFETDSIVIPIEHNLLSVLSLSNISLIYKEINNALYYNFENFTATNKKCLLFNFDLEATEQGNNLILVQTIGQLESTKSVQAGIDPFGHQDFWYNGLFDGAVENGVERPGMCGDYEGMLLGHDHTTRLEKSVQSFYYTHVAASLKSAKDVNTQVYYTNVYTKGLYDGENLHYGPFNDCISPEQMNEYHHKICEKIENSENQQSDGTVFTGICDIDNRLYTGGSNLVTALETMQVGIKNVGPIEPGELEPGPLSIIP